jgi:hypothetical protein
MENSPLKTRNRPNIGPILEVDDSVMAVLHV